MKPSTLQVLQREARLRGNTARLALQSAQATLDEKARALDELSAQRHALDAELQRFAAAPKECAASALRRERWQAKLRADRAALASRHQRALDALRACEANVEQLRRDVTDALRRKQATESLEHAMRDAESRRRERRAQGLLDETAAWRTARRGVPGRTPD